MHSFLLLLHFFCFAPFSFLSKKQILEIKIIRESWKHEPVLKPVTLKIFQYNHLVKINFKKRIRNMLSTFHLRGKKKIILVMQSRDRLLWKYNFEPLR